MTVRTTALCGPDQRSVTRIEIAGKQLVFGIRGDRVELACEPFGPSALSESSNGEVTDARFLQWLNHWLNLTVVLNEMSRSMGVPDFYPFVLSQPAVRKLHLVHRIISHKTPRSARRRTRPATPAQS